jgi:hypothetical protein
VEYQNRFFTDLGFEERERDFLLIELKEMIKSLTKKKEINLKDIENLEL